MNYKLSNQAVGAIMLALQKGILEEADITNILKGFEVLDSADGLIVKNPPNVKISAAENEEKVIMPTAKPKRKTRRKRKVTKKEPVSD
jgi:hypothetical protein